MARGTHHQGDARRELRVAPEVAQLLPSAQLAHLEAMVDDPDNHCGGCEKPIRGAAAAAVAFWDERFVLVRLAHPECVSSGVYHVPGLRAGAKQALQDAPGPFLHGRLQLRSRAPRAVLLLEPATLFACGEEDPLEVWARGLGLAPAGGALEALAPPLAPCLHLARDGEVLFLIHSLGGDQVAAEGVDQAQWWGAGEGEALVLMARGLGLTRPEPCVADALRCRPAWAAIVDLTDAPAPRQRSGQLRRFSGLLEKIVNVD